MDDEVKMGSDLIQFLSDHPDGEEIRQLTEIGVTDFEGFLFELMQVRDFVKSTFVDPVIRLERQGECGMAMVLCSLSARLERQLQNAPNRNWRGPCEATIARLRAIGDENEGLINDFEAAAARLHPYMQGNRDSWMAYEDCVRGEAALLRQMEVMIRDAGPAPLTQFGFMDPWSANTAGSVARADAMATGLPPPPLELAAREQLTAWTDVAIAGANVPYEQWNFLQHFINIYNTRPELRSIALLGIEMALTSVANADVESMFSTAKLILDDRRERMLPTRLGGLLLLERNASLSEQCVTLIVREWLAGRRGGLPGATFVVWLYAASGSKRE
jgi:hypothetical protein